MFYTTKDFFFDRDKGFGISQGPKDSKGFSRWCTDKEMKSTLSELDIRAPHYNKAGGVNFNDFCQTVNNRIPERETTEDLRKVFNLFLDDPNDTTTSLASIKRVADELGENFEEAELNAMLTKASKSGANLTFEDFVSIMTGNEQI